jgi:DNA repair protein REV1
MAQYGGEYEQFISSKVTHLICINLAESKLKQFGEMGNPPKIVFPNWITDCVQAQCLLSVKDYLVANRKHSNKPLESILLGDFQKNSRLHMIGNYKKKYDHVDTLGEEVGDGVTKFVVHLDMDCFFASVAMRENPSLIDKPIAVSHSENGTGDISSANYIARGHGIKAGMWMNTARELCPELIVVPYELEKYQSTAQTMNNILFDICEQQHVRIVSIDEAYIDITKFCSNESREAQEMVSRIRKRIKSETGCSCSAGISHNMLLARMATKCGKPDGQFYFADDDETVKEFFIKQKIQLGDIPGIGRKTLRKIQEIFGEITLAQDLWGAPLERLKEIFGTKTGESIYYHIRGVPTGEPRTITSAKSVGVEMNYGIRFTMKEEVRY